MQDDANTYTVFMGSWNVFGQSPKESLKGWLDVYPDAPDFYVIGFQEMDMSMRKEKSACTNKGKEGEWFQAVKAGLNSQSNYKQLQVVQHQHGVMMIVLAKEMLFDHVKNVASETVDTDSRGGVAIRFDFHQTSICFVNCHLAPFMEDCDKRNQDYSDICARMAFNQFKPSKYIEDHDHIYWMGDLNYRIDLEINFVKSSIEKKDFSSLIGYDQLAIQRSLKKVFVEFNENTINFPPTYKYDIGTSNWDSSTKNRTPAWCDRILWKGDKIVQKAYRSHPDFCCSDHKPISGYFESTVKVNTNDEKE